MSASAIGASGTTRPPTPSTFDLWAEVYDSQLNPFLSLEERILAALLPDLRGLDVLDAGCGTGRKLSLLKARNARKLIGVDSSHVMLDHARAAHECDIRYGSCTDLPLPNHSIDCAVSSFVLSYISDLGAFADELQRVTRPGSILLLSDVHPATAQLLNWKRSFRVNGDEIEIASKNWQIDQIRAVFSSRGFRVQACIEPRFAGPEQNIFLQSAKSDGFSRLRDSPAIYVLRLIREWTPLPTLQLAFITERCAVTSVDAATSTIIVRDGKIDQLNSRLQTQSLRDTTAIDLTGYLVLPGLINAHDHLEFSLFPRLGRGPYENATQWAEDIHRSSADVIALHRNVPHDVRVTWGAIRNLLAGVTTVCHHNPLTPVMLGPDFPVRVVQEFSWAHSLAINGNLSTKFESSPADRPFIVHAAEGVDAASTSEVQQLMEQGVLQQNTVLIHGLAIPLESVAEINRSGAALVTCPSSNAFLFNRVPSPELLTGISNVALGSDSPLTAAGDLLDELRFAHTHIGLNEDQLYRMVTAMPAQLLRLMCGEGRLAPGSGADFIATKDRGLTPAMTLARMSSSDVELVVRSGRVFLASDTIYQRLPDSERTGLESLSVDGNVRWIRAQLAPLFYGAASVMEGNTLTLAGKKVTCGRSV